MRTLVGDAEGPEPPPSEVPFFTKPTRDEDDPEGCLVWTGTLGLRSKVDFTALAFTELVGLARRHLKEAFPDEAVPMRIFIVPDAPVETIRPEQIAEVSIGPTGGHSAPVEEA
jgi:hypothetical protein